MSSAKRLFLAACVASSFALVGCASDSDHSSRSDRGNNGTYDNATSAGTRNQGGSVGVGPSSSNDNVPNNTSRTPARDTTNTGTGAGSRIDGRSGTDADPTGGANNARPGINGGAGDTVPDNTRHSTTTGDQRIRNTGVGSGNSDTATGTDNVRPGNSDTPAPTTPKSSKPADKSDSGAGVGSGNSDSAAGTDSGSGDVDKK